MWGTSVGAPLSKAKGRRLVRRDASPYAQHDHHTLLPPPIHVTNETRLGTVKRSALGALLTTENVIYLGLTIFLPFTLCIHHRQRQGKREARTFIHLASDGNFPAVSLDDFFDNR